MNVLKSFSSMTHIKRLAAHVWRHFREDRLFDEAASLSYTSLLSMVPLLAVVFGVASAFPVFASMVTIFSRFTLPRCGQQTAHVVVAVQR